MSGRTLRGSARSTAATVAILSFLLLNAAVPPVAAGAAGVTAPASGSAGVGDGTPVDPETSSAWRNGESAGATVAFAQESPSPPGAAGHVPRQGTDTASTRTVPGTIRTVRLSAVVDENDNDAYADFDLYVEADTRLPEGNDDLDGEAEPRLDVFVNGDPVREDVEVAASRSLSGTLTVPESSLPTADDPDLRVTVVLRDADPVDGEVLDRYSGTVPYEANETPLSLAVSRSGTVAGSPVYFRPSDPGATYSWQVVEAPAGADPRVRNHSGSVGVLRAEATGTYVVEANATYGNTATRRVTVSGRSALIDRYAPIVHYDRGERYRPTRYEALVENARLLDEGSVGSDRLADAPSVFDLRRYPDGVEPVVDLNGTESEFPAYDDDYPPTVYASVHRDAEFRGHEYTAVTYWLLYVYDPKAGGISAFAEHESDLETVTVLINDTGAQWVAASQHLGGERREWEKTDRTGTHLHLYPAVGAHSNFLTDTGRYDGEGLALQNQFVADRVPGVGMTADVLSDLYVDTTDDDRVLSPDGSVGSEYELVPLTGEEVWADFNGGFDDGPDAGQVPMRRERWTAPGEWAGTEVLADERQRDAAVRSTEVEVTDGRLSVTTTVENVGPKPDTFYVQVRARPSGASWTGPRADTLGVVQQRLGTAATRQVTTTVPANASVAARWDLNVSVLTHPPTVAEPEDIVASEPVPDAYVVPVVAEAGRDRRVTPGEPVELDATGSAVVDAEPDDVSWTQVGGPEVDLTDTDTLTPTFVAPDTGATTTLTFTVRVSERSTTDTDRVEVVVDPTSGGGGGVDLTGDGSPSTSGNGRFADTPLHEDATGDGEVTTADVVALFRGLDAAAEHPTLFDFTGDGEVTTADVVELFGHL